MSRRRKLEKFADIRNYNHVYEMSDPGSSLLMQNVTTKLELRGKWKELVFQNDHPICLELACGRGEYTVGLARKNKNINYIGVDIKGARIWQGATIAKEEQLEDVAFLRIRIEHIKQYFAPEEITAIWITFPDPFPQKENRRLTCPLMLAKYHELLEPDGKIFFKTDDTDLFEYTLQVLQDSTQFRLEYFNHDIYASTLLNDDLEIKTYYERQHLRDGKKIKFMVMEKI